MGRKFELVSKYVGTELEKGFKMPRRATKRSACYDIFNNTGKEIVLQPGELSKKIEAFIKIQMEPDEVCQFFVRSSHGFGYSVRLANSTGIIDCVPAGTLISTPTGDVPVEMLMNMSNPSVRSFNEETHEIEDDIIDDIWVVNDLPLIKIETEIGTVEIPEEKTVFTKRGWIAAKDLTISDQILSI